MKGNPIFMASTVKRRASNTTGANAPPTLPACDKCGASDKVRRLGPDYFGSEFRCSRCRIQWAQSS
jgi:transposase-like protein